MQDITNLIKEDFEEWR